MKISSERLKFLVNGNELKLSKTVDNISIFNIYGMQLVNESNVSSINLNIASGVYVVEVLDGANVYAEKIIVK